MRRVIIAVNIDREGYDRHDIADSLEGHAGLSDPTVWEWSGFWADVQEGVIGPDGDGTSELPLQKYALPDGTTAMGVRLELMDDGEV